MSVLVLVRHGQASLQGGGYGRLSELGVRQSRLLGTHWAGWPLRIDAVYVGPRRRHRETCEAAAAAYREAGLPWPDPTPLDELDEYPGPELARRFLPLLAERDPEVRALLAEGSAASVPGVVGRLAREVGRRWASGELPAPDLETWAEVRARVERGIEKMTGASGRGRTVIAFTSGGPVAAAAGRALGLGDERTFELSGVVRNASCTEILFSGQRLGLRTFNATPHLGEPAQVTEL